MMETAEELGKEIGVRSACEALGVPRASVYRRRQPAGPADPKTNPRKPPRSLSPKERESVKEVLFAERHMDASPREIYAKLLDEGRYLCSVRTMYRILDENQACRERRDQLRHPNYEKPELLATGANQVWSWDITKLKGPEKWTYYYLYSILDIYSRYTVGWMLARRESTDLAKRLIEETIDKQHVSRDQLTLHSDRGPSMASHGVAQLLASLGVTKSHSRPHVSNDNPFSESQFKTMKYRPEFPKRFDSFEQSHEFCRGFFRWYNDEHYHVGIGLMTPATVHYGEADQARESRQQILHAAYARHPERFVRGKPAAPQVPTAVYINAPKPPEPTHEKRLPEPQCPQKPSTSLTHPRSGYPSSSCVPAELASVSPDNQHDTGCSPFEHPSHSSENSGGLGAGPQETV
jgi:putative transposase